MFGAIGGMLPMRLGGSATEGVTAAQWARLTADWYAIRQTVPLFRFAWRVSGGVPDKAYYHGQNGSGLAYAPDVLEINSDGGVVGLDIGWTEMSFTDEYGVKSGLIIRGAVARFFDGGFAEATVSLPTGSPPMSPLRVTCYNAAGTAITPLTGWVMVW